MLVLLPCLYGYGLFLRFQYLSARWSCKLYSTDLLCILFQYKLLPSHSVIQSYDQGLLLHPRHKYLHKSINIPYNQHLYRLHLRLSELRSCGRLPQSLRLLLPYYHKRYNMCHLYNHLAYRFLLRCLLPLIHRLDVDMQSHSETKHNILIVHRFHCCYHRRTVNTLQPRYLYQMHPIQRYVLLYKHQKHRKPYDPHMESLFHCNKV